MRGSRPLCRRRLTCVYKVSKVRQLRKQHIIIANDAKLLKAVLVSTLLLLPRQNVSISIVTINHDATQTCRHLNRRFNGARFAFLRRSIAYPFPRSLRTSCVFPLTDGARPVTCDACPVTAVAAGLCNTVRTLSLTTQAKTVIVCPSSIRVCNGGAASITFARAVAKRLALTADQTKCARSGHYTRTLYRYCDTRQNIDMHLTHLYHLLNPALLPASDGTTARFLNGTLHRRSVILGDTNARLFSCVCTYSTVATVLRVLFCNASGRTCGITRPVYSVLLHSFTTTYTTMTNAGIVFSLPSTMRRQNFSVTRHTAVSDDGLRTLN